MGASWLQRGCSPGPDSTGLVLPCIVPALTPSTLPHMQACILILYGDDPVASNNVLLGQFDIVNIPPAPKDVPRIEVRAEGGGERGKGGRVGWG